MEWMENLSDELKENNTLKQYTSLESALKGFIESKAAGSNSIRIHGPDASAEAVAENYQKIMKHFPHLVMKPDVNNPEQMKVHNAMMGVPEDVDGYLWEGEGLDATIVSELKALAHDTGMSKTQFNKYIKKMAEMQGATNQQSEDARVRMGAELKNEWGMAFEDRYAVVERHLHDNPGLGDVSQMSPSQMQAHYQMSRSLNGTKQMNQQPYVQDSQNTPEEAKAKMKEIMDNPVYFSSDPKDRFVQAEMRKKIPQLIRESNPS